MAKAKQKPITRAGITRRRNAAKRRRLRLRTPLGLDADGASSAQNINRRPVVARDRMGTGASSEGRSRAQRRAVRLLPEARDQRRLDARRRSKGPQEDDRRTPRAPEG